MRKIVIGICDDIPAAVRQIERVVETYRQESGTELEIHTFLSGKEVLDCLEDIDILFLDIEMPEMDGIEVGREIRRRNSNCKIIMATSKIERFKETYKIGTFRFVSKPFDEDEVLEALADAMQTMIGLEVLELFEKRQSFLVRQRDICVVKSFGSYIEANVGKRQMRKDCTMAEIEEELNKQLFYKIDRKYMVNMLHIEKYDNGTLVIGNEIFKVSRRRKKEFERTYREFDVLYGGER